MKKISRWLWQGTRFLALLLGVSTALYTLLPFTRLKILANSLAKDGNLELFTSDLYANSRSIAVAGTLLFFATFLLLTIWHEKSLTWFKNVLIVLRRFPAVLRTDRKNFWQKTRTYLAHDSDWLIILGLMLVGAFFRIQLLDKPVYHDEAYTYLTFVLGGLGNVISDYHLPNNHILYSVLVFFSTQLLGNAPWVLRLPALLAGLLLIPATYFATRQYFNRVAALLSSGITAVLPIFMIYGTSARGYTQVALLSTLLWLWGILLLKEKNHYIWLLFVLTAAAGFYTIPIMLYPYTAIMAWLFVAWLFKKHSTEYGRSEFFTYLFISGLIVVLLFLLLYTPVFLKSGVGSVINNPTVQKNQEATFNLLRDSLTSRGSNAWAEWHLGMPTWLKQVTLFSAGMGMIYALIAERKYIDYFSISLFTILLIVFFQRSVGWKRVWFFFAPIYFSFAAAGIIYLFKNLIKLGERVAMISAAILLVLTLLSTIIWMRTRTQEMRELLGAPSAIERGILHIETILESDIAIVANANLTPQMQYYADYHGIDLEQTHPANNQFTSLYVMMTAEDDNLEETLHSGTRDRVDLNASELIYTDSDLQIFQIPIIVFYAE